MKRILWSRKTEEEYVRRTNEKIYNIYGDSTTDVVVGNGRGEGCVEAGIQGDHDKAGGTLSQWI